MGRVRELVDRVGILRPLRVRDFAFLWIGSDRLVHRRRCLHHRDRLADVRPVELAVGARRGRRGVEPAADRPVADLRRPVRPARSPAPHDRGRRDPRVRGRHDRDHVDRRNAHDPLAARVRRGLRGRAGVVRAGVLLDRPADRPGGSVGRGQRARSVRSAGHLDPDRAAPGRRPDRERRDRLGVRPRRDDVRVLRPDDRADAQPPRTPDRGRAHLTVGRPQGGSPLRAEQAVVVGRDGHGHREPAGHLGAVGGARPLRGPQRPGRIGGGTRAGLRRWRGRIGDGGARVRSAGSAPTTGPDGPVPHVGAWGC